MRKILAIIWVFLLIPALGAFTAAFGGEGKMIPFQLNQQGSPKKVAPDQLNSLVETAILAGTNQERQKKGLSPLSDQALLKKAAVDHSRDMMRRSYLSHFSPEGKSVVDRVQKYVKPLQTSVGENLHTIQSGKGLYDAQAIADLMLSDWMHSKSHRKNILGKQFTQLGVGCASDGREIYCTQVFSGPNLSPR